MPYRTTGTLCVVWLISLRHLSTMTLARCACRGAQVHRDVNGSANACSKAAYGRYGQVQADRIKYLRPIVVAPRHRAT